MFANFSFLELFDIPFHVDIFLDKDFLFDVFASGEADAHLYNQIIHNPGTIPSPFFLPHTDLTVVFEGAYDTYKSKKLAADVSRFKKRTKVSRHKLALVVHSMSGTIGTKDYINVVKNMKKDVGTLFLTGLRMNYYERFEDNFGDWIEALN
jgi:hypothetical protein